MHTRSLNRAVGFIRHVVSMAATLLVVAFLLAAVSVHTELDTHRTAPAVGLGLRPAAFQATAQPPPIFAPIASVSADPPYQLVGHSVLLTAQIESGAPSDPYLLRIKDAAGNVVGECLSTAVCSHSVSQQTPGQQVYKAEIFKDGAVQPSVSTYKETVTWRRQLVLNVNARAVNNGGPTTLTATSDTDVEAPYYIQIYNAGTGGTRLGACRGTTCTHTYTQGGTTDYHFVAYIAKDTMTNPPADAQATSNELIVQNTVLR